MCAELSAYALTSRAMYDLTSRAFGADAQSGAAGGRADQVKNDLMADDLSSWR